jgi:hypothetical protein
MSAKTFKPACFSAAEIQDWAIGVPQRFATSID